MDCPSDHGQMIKEPLLSNPKGGIKVLPFILANEAFERLANYGLFPNLILYLTREYRIDAAKGALILFLLSSATNFTPILGAFLADSYVGRYRMIGFGCMASLLVTYHTKGSKLLVPSEKLRFLNKACIIINPQEDLAPDGKASDSWSLCTVDQVEDLKALIKVIPIWSAGMLKSVNVSQSSFLVLQASTMERHITSKFEVPAASFPSISVLVITTWVVLYDRIIIPLASKARGKIVCLNLKQRMGIGILLSTISMAALAIAESCRRETAIKEGFSDDPDAQLNISAVWLLPHFILSGLAEAFNAIAQNEFFYAELPKTMSSVASTLQGLGLSAASLVSSFIVSAVRDFTGGEAQESWVSSNINKGHYDYYYWLLTVLSLVNFVYYLVCSQFYGPCREEEEEEEEGPDR
ncbi:OLIGOPEPTIDE TRANSPORTER-RELATED [Salix koriyanagi]|uniref:OLIGOPEPTIDE TRANSPORTER-RELATED n=1 Tax=Salix koriyanagi TaxID=2511006 RepID=A0A9Q0W3M8_9ROSI|nr:OLIGOPEPTIDE TRANSPORTER-RELATED [Salix koriyanagi]